MDEDGQRIAAHPSTAGDDVDGSGDVGGIAGGVVCDPASGVAVPSSTAELACVGAAGDHIGDIHGGMAVCVKNSVGVVGYADGGALAIDGSGCGDLAELRKVERNSCELGGQRDRGGLSYDRASVSAAIGDGGLLGTA